MRRDFSVSEEDVEGLDARGQAWDTVTENGVRWLIVRGFPLPEGYNHRQADAAIRIPPAYPDVDIDMVYFFPQLSLVSGKVIGQTQVSLTIEGKPYQQWSRHRTSQNPWRAGLDNICTHLLQVSTWLKREIGLVT